MLSFYCVCMYVCMCMYVCVCVCACACVCVCVCVICAQNNDSRIELNLETEDRTKAHDRGKKTEKDSEDVHRRLTLDVPQSPINARCV